MIGAGAPRCMQSNPAFLAGESRGDVGTAVQALKVGAVVTSALTGVVEATEGTTRRRPRGSSGSARDGGDPPCPCYGEPWSLYHCRPRMLATRLGLDSASSRQAR
jgi:hypothetical protein